MARGGRTFVSVLVLASPDLASACAFGSFCFFSALDGLRWDSPDDVELWLLLLAC